MIRRSPLRNERIRYHNNIVPWIGEWHGGDHFVMYEYFDMIHGGWKKFQNGYRERDSECEMEELQGELERLLIQFDEEAEQKEFLKNRVDELEDTVFKLQKEFDAIKQHLANRATDLQELEQIVTRPDVATPNIEK